MTAERQCVGVREMRQNLSVYLRRVAAGEVFEVTERRRPVAILAPLPERASALDRLVADGRLRPPARPGRKTPAPLGGPPLSPALADVREDPT